MRLLNLLYVFAFSFGPMFAFAQGNCSQDDLLYIGANNPFVQEVTSQCGQQCLFADDPEGCFAECMSAQVPLTDLCISCFSNQVDCVTSQCFFPCVFGSEAQCAACVEANCLADFQVCAGVVDNDGDGFTTLEDCDDSNPSVYPGAPGTNQGIDNNCDGIIDETECLLSTFFADADEDGFGNPAVSIEACEAPVGFVENNTDCDDTNPNVFPGAPGTNEGIDNNCDGLVAGNELVDPESCPGDFDADNIVATSDLLIFLSAFGCTGVCVGDLNLDELVNTGDLLLFLSVFGTTCD